MNKGSYIIGKILRKEGGILIDESPKLEIRREFHVDTSEKWSIAEVCVRKAAVELKEAENYIVRYASKRKNGVFPVDIEINGKEHRVLCEFVDCGSKKREVRIFAVV